MSIVISQSPAQQAAQELVDKTNEFLAHLEQVIKQGASAEGSRADVSATELQTALGAALVKLQEIIAIGA